MTAGAGRIVLVAGEPSGDRHGAALARALRAHPSLGGFALVGVAGPAMRAAGVTPLVAMEDVAVVGVVEVLRHLPALLSARGRIAQALSDPATRLFLPIDFPGFNLPLCRNARARGVPVLYYIAPQVWAWGKGRLGALRRDVDALAVVLPFEEAFFREARVRVRAVGHPLMESLDPAVSRSGFMGELGWPDDARFVALLPGSRDQEIARLAVPLLRAARRFLESRSDARAVVAAASPVHAARLARVAGREAPAPAAAGTLRVVVDRTREALAYARCAAVASGTATLESAALGTPLVAVYRLAAPSYWLAKRLVRLDRFALANLVAGEDVAPELLQGQVTPARVAEALRSLYDEGPARTRALVGVGRVRGLLGGPGASRAVAQLASELVAGERP